MASYREHPMTAHRVLFGDALDVLRGLEAASVDCCATSPPWGLRDYGVEGQLGLEATVQEYVARLVEVFAEVRRVLKPGGTLWLNLGDTFASTCYNPGGGEANFAQRRKAAGAHPPDRGSVTSLREQGLKPKDLCGVPWRVALALQADGWWLRNDVIWAKTNRLPESVTDRFSSTHEHVFLLTRAARYWLDLEAVRSERASTFQFDRGDVWCIATQPTPYAHFATWPEALVERMILTGCPPKVCAECGVPWEHRVKKTGDDAEDLGYHPACRCQEHSARSQPGLVLDPFCGSGTTLQVARKLNRRSIGIELNPDYEAVMRQRLGCDGELFEDVSFEQLETTLCANP